MTPSPIPRWHDIVRSHDAALLPALLADDVVFESPVVHTPQPGKAVTLQYLGAAMQVFNNSSFRYVNEWHGPHSAVLEFETTCDGIAVNGVDMIAWNGDGLITHFKVMIRPLKAINKIHEMMGQTLRSGRIG
ncbi:MAG: nuclear transport factor 2 family protein [Burkholderiaceae bacterium]|nr:nuclear transport factor 2 family protein [Burkholderiaceae bacterium]